MSLSGLGDISKDVKLMSSESRKAEKKCGPEQIMPEMFPIWQKTQA